MSTAERLKERRDAAKSDDAAEDYTVVPEVEPPRKPSKEYQGREDYKGFKMPRGMSLPQQRSWKKAIDERATEKADELIGERPSALGVKSFGAPGGTLPPPAEEPEFIKPMEGATAGDIARRALEVGSMSPIGQAAQAGADVGITGMDIAAGDYPGAAISAASVLLPFVSAGWLKQALRHGEVPAEAAEKIADLEKRFKAGDVTDEMQIRRELASIEDAHGADYQASLSDDPLVDPPGHPDMTWEKMVQEEEMGKKLGPAGREGPGGGGPGSRQSFIDDVAGEYQGWTDPETLKWIDEQPDYAEPYKSQFQGPEHPSKFWDELDDDTLKTMDRLAKEGRHQEGYFTFAQKYKDKHGTYPFKADQYEMDLYQYENWVDADVHPNIARPDPADYGLAPRGGAPGGAGPGGGAAVSDKLTPEDRKWLQDEIQQSNEALRKNPVGDPRLGDGSEDYSLLNEASLVTEQYRDMYQHMLDNDTKLYAGQVVTTDLPSMKGAGPGGVGRSPKFGLEDMRGKVEGGEFPSAAPVVRDLGPLTEDDRYVLGRDPKAQGLSDDELRVLRDEYAAYGYEDFSREDFSRSEPKSGDADIEDVKELMRREVAATQQEKAVAPAFRQQEEAVRRRRRTPAARRQRPKDTDE
jgi:hypothetical protein